MSEGPPSPKRLRLDLDDLGNLSREELIEKLREQDDYLSYYQGRQRGRSSSDKDDGDDKEADDKLKQQSTGSSRRENTLVMRLTNKEQELQDCLNQVAEMKTAQTQNSAQLRSLLLDPAVNLVFQRMAKDMEDCKEKLKQTQNELSAWKFTADSQMGKRLMAKCRMLLQENEDLGKMISSGRTAKLEAEIALQKTMVTEMKTNQDEMNEFVGELEEDVEGMQSMIYVLQQQLKDTKEQLAASEADNTRLRSLLASSSTSAPRSSQPEPGGGGRETTVNKSGEDGDGGGDGSSGRTSGTCATEGCEPETTVGYDRTSSCDIDTSSPQQQQPLTPNSEGSRTRTSELHSPQPSKSPQTAVSPQNTSSPQTTANAHSTVSPQASVSQQTSINAQTSVSPQASSSPQTSVTPQGSVNPRTLINPQTSISPETTSAVTTQPSTEEPGMRTNCDKDLDFQQPNGRTTDVGEDSQYQCSMTAADTPNLRTDQTCDVAAMKTRDDHSADLGAKADRDTRTSDDGLVDVKTCNPESRHVRNGGLEAVVQPDGETDEM